MVCAYYNSQDKVGEFLEEVLYMSSKMITKSVPYM